MEGPGLAQAREERAEGGHLVPTGGHQEDGARVVTGVQSRRLRERGV